MAAPAGEMICSKPMTMTDLNERLHCPADFVRELPPFNGGHQVEFTGKDKTGKIFNFRCSRRINGPYHKTVISAGWIPFVRSKGNLKPGDTVIFYRSDDPDVLFDIRFNRKVLLFGHNINEAQE